MPKVVVPGRNCCGFSPCMRWRYVAAELLPSAPPFFEGCGCKVRDIEPDKLPHGRALSECEYCELMEPKKLKSVFGHVRAKLLAAGDVTVRDILGERGEAPPNLAELGFTQKGNRISPEKQAKAKEEMALRRSIKPEPIEIVITGQSIADRYGITLDELDEQFAEFNRRRSGGVKNKN